MSLLQKSVKIKSTCKDLNIKNYSSKKKVELIDLINNTNNTNNTMTSNTTINNTTNSVDLKKIIKSIHKLLKTKKFINLFCGIGGFHQALITFDLECLLACDIDSVSSNMRKIMVLNQ